MNPEPFRIEPTFSPRIWGSRSLAPLYPEKTNLPEPIGESWLTDVNCRVATGIFTGKTLGEAWREMPAEWRGSNFASPGDFPLLVKFIFPADKLSIQVHPDDAYASVHEKAAGGHGKTEMWHVVSAEPGARLLAGLKQGVTKEIFRQAMDSAKLEELFQSHEVRAGDTFFISAGTPHTIGPGMVLCEVQQYSDLTYRVYDYGRVDAQGKPRELHTEKALQVTNFSGRQSFKTRPLAMQRDGLNLAMDDSGGSLLAACKYFGVNKWDISRPQKRYEGDLQFSFSLFVFLGGAGQVVWREGSSLYRVGECWFLPAEFAEFSVAPSRPTSILEAFVPDAPLLVKQLRSQGFANDSLSQTVFL
jgi:mannose-6-phosphate isomerase